MRSDSVSNAWVVITQSLKASVFSSKNANQRNTSSTDSALTLPLIAWYSTRAQEFVLRVWTEHQQMLDFAVRAAKQYMEGNALP